MTEPPAASVSVTNTVGGIVPRQRRPVSRIDRIAGAVLTVVVVIAAALYIALTR